MFYKELETERMTLKNISAEDRAFIFSQFSNVDINRYLFDAEPINSLEEADEIIGFYLQPEPRGHHRWILVNKSGGGKIGTCGFHGYNHKESSIEMGYDLQKEIWGKGYMSEALETIIKFAKESMKIKRIHACIYIRNENSIKLAQKLGFVLTDTRNETFRRKEYLHNVYTLDI